MENRYQQRLYLAGESSGRNDSNSQSIKAQEDGKNSGGSVLHMPNLQGRHMYIEEGIDTMPSKAGNKGPNNDEAAEARHSLDLNVINTFPVQESDRQNCYH